MPRPDPDHLVADAQKLRQERFALRDAMLMTRQAERFNKTVVDVPTAYKTTAHQHESSIIEDEGRQIGTLVYAVPIPHIPPGVPEDQPKTTVMEKFLMAWFAETEAVYGPIWWQETLAQVHSNIAWEYLGWRRVPYKGQPQPPKDEGDIAASAEYGMRNDRFKRDAGVKSYCERRYIPTATAYPQGSVFDPDRFYEIKQVPERDLFATYGIVRDSDGGYSKPSGDAAGALGGITSVPSGYPQGQGASETLVQVVEYWDRQWCMIIAQTARSKWLGTRQVREGFVLEEWQHNWGRVPYFARPAFVTDQIEEEHRFAGPLDAVYTEMPSHKKLRVMGFSVAYQTAFSPLQIVTKESGDLILDDGGKPLEFLKLVPGEARQMAPGQSVMPIPQSPEIGNLYQEIAASQQRIEHFSLSPVAKGIAPGADTANAALSNLHRFQLSVLDPLAQQASREAGAMFRFVLERIREMKERVYVFDAATDAYLSLSADEITSVNAQAHVTPDQGQFQLLIEKHAMEMYLNKVITLTQMYEMMGKENPEELVLDLKAERYADSLEPVVMQQITADMGMLDAVNAMIAQNAQSGSARDAVPPLMDKVNQLNGQGSGSPGQPRTEGVRSTTTPQTTQPQLSGGY